MNWKGKGSPLHASMNKDIKIDKDKHDHELHFYFSRFSFLESAVCVILQSLHTPHARHPKFCLDSSVCSVWTGLLHDRHIIRFVGIILLAPSPSSPLHVI